MASAQISKMTHRKEFSVISDHFILYKSCNKKLPQIEKDGAKAIGPAQQFLKTGRNAVTINSKLIKA